MSQPVRRRVPDWEEESGGNAGRTLAGCRGGDMESATPEKTEQLQTRPRGSTVSGERETVVHLTSWSDGKIIKQVPLKLARDLQRKHDEHQTHNLHLSETFFLSW